MRQGQLSLNLNRCFSILAFVMLLLICINGISATSDDSIAMQSDNASTSDAIPLENSSETDSTQPLTPYEKLSNDLASGAKTVYLTQDVKVNETLIIKNNVLIDAKGHTIDAEYNTRIFKVVDCKLTIKNAVLKNGFSDNGGAIYCFRASLAVDACKFINNKATKNGGAICVCHGNLNVVNSYFEGNTVRSNDLNGHGGAIWLYDGSSYISKSTFKSNYCISNILKNHKQASKYGFKGGAIYITHGSSHIITKSNFIGNKVSNDGGAIYIYNSGHVRIDGCRFSSNSVVYEDGGAIVFTGSKLVLKNSIFYKNRAYEDGGAIDSFSLSKKKIHIQIIKCTFNKNTAYKGGGAIWMGLKTVYSMKNNKFTNNRATIGGAIYCQDGIVKIFKCLFKSNKAKQVTSWKVRAKGGWVLHHSGGAILIQNKNVKITKSVFKKNSADYGGSLFFLGGKLKIKYNTFSSNNAKKYAKEICASKKLKISNKNKWTNKKISSKKALKNKKLFINVSV